MQSSPVTAEQVQQIRELWSTSATATDICAAVGCTRDQLTKIRRDAQLPSRQGQGRKPRRSADPTPEEIKQRAADCRRLWTEQEYIMRQNLPAEPADDPGMPVAAPDGPWRLFSLD